MPKLKDFQPDNHNANKGTLKGQKMIISSIEQDGFGRSMLADKAGRIIGGNKTLEASAEVFGTDVEPIVVETDGKRPVIVQRTDLDLSDPTGAARRLAYRDNLASWFSFSLDPEVVMADMEAGFDFEGIDITTLDLGELLEGASDELLGENSSGQNFNGQSQVIPEQFMILIECNSEQEQAERLEQLTEMGYQCKALIS